MIAEQLANESQQQHRRYFELYGPAPVAGDRLRTVSDYIRDVSHEVYHVRQTVITSAFSTAVVAQYATATTDDHILLANAANFSDTAARAADTSSRVITEGAQAIASQANSEAAHVGAIPDPDSPAGLGAVLAIIAEHQAKSATTVEQSAATIVAAGQRAAAG